MKIIFAIMLFALVTRASAQTPMFPVGEVKEGVYFLNGWAQTTIVELKNGQFRYWFSSDMKGFWEETPYPQTGNYTTNGGTVRFVVNTGSWTEINSINAVTGVTVLGGSVSPGFVGVSTNRLVFFSTNEWTFMNFKGQTTLWGPQGVKHWEKVKDANGYNVLFPTDRKPEEIWEHKGWQPQNKSSP